MTLTTGASTTGSAAGAGSILQLFLHGETWTRAAITELTGLARSTVGLRLDTLVATGFVVPVAESASTGGRPPARFRFNPSNQVVLGADLGATHARLALTDLEGSVLTERAADVEIADGPDSVLQWLGEQAQQMLVDIDRPTTDLLGVGIGLPGPVEHSTGRPTNPPIMPGWDGYDVPGAVQAQLGCPVLVDNDVNVMALGEMALAERRTPGVDMSHMVFVKVATGIGAGIIGGGRLQRGAQGAAGDLGHVQAPHGGDVACRCGNVGCLEAIASGMAVAERLSSEGVPAHNTRDVVDLVRGGNLPATLALRQAGRDLGEVLATAVSLLNPSVIVIGGLMAEAGESLLAGVREVVYARSLPLATGNLRIVASVAGPEAGVVGAAMLVISEELSPQRFDERLAGRPA